MKKVISLVAVSAVTLLMGAGMASAATISDAIFSNGDTTIDAQGNSSVSGTFTLQVGSNEVCEVLRTQATPEPFTDTQVGGSLGYQQGTYTNVPFNVRVSPNTGTYYPTVQCAGIWGGNHSVDGADNVVATGNLGTVRVTANGSSSTGSSSSMDQLTALVAALTAQVNAILHPTTTPVTTPAKPACSPLLLSATPGATTPVNGQLQGYLIGQGFSIPALMSAHPAPFGYFGAQTQLAVNAYRGTCQ